MQWRVLTQDCTEHMFLVWNHLHYQMHFFSYEVNEKHHHTEQNGW